MRACDSAKLVSSLLVATYMLETELHELISGQHFTAPSTPEHKPYSVGSKVKCSVMNMG